MKKNAAYIAFTVFFIVLLISGTVTIPLIKQNGTAEKRVLARFPSFRTEDGVNPSFASEFEDWLDDHVGLRMLWTQQYAKLNSLLGTSSTDQVIIGTDGWLYFVNTISDYTGVDGLTEDELWRVKYTLELMDEGLEKPFIVLFAPNKNSIYPEHMPSSYPRSAEPHAADWLLENCKVKLLNVKSVLTDDGLYYRTDTHWNAKGARIAADLLIDAINEAAGANAEKPDVFSEYSSEPYTGDLGQMLSPYDPPVDEKIVYSDAAQNYRYEGRHKTDEDITIVTTGGTEPLNVLMLRDSFTNALVENISNAYSNATYRRAMPMPLNDASDFDVVVLEMVERRIGELLTGAPILFAPETAAWEGVEINASAQAYVTMDNNGTRVYGCVSDVPSRVEEIIVAVTHEGTTKYYKAFPAGETGFEDDPGAYSLLLPEVQGDITTQIFMRGSDGYALSEPVAAQTTER